MSCNDSRRDRRIRRRSLDAAGRRALERHVEGCVDCRALVGDLKRIQAAAFTLDGPIPRLAILEALQAAVAAEPVPDAPASPGVAAHAKARVPLARRRRDHRPATARAVIDAPARTTRPGRTTPTPARSDRIVAADFQAAEALPQGDPGPRADCENRQRRSRSAGRGCPAEKLAGDRSGDRRNPPRSRASRPAATRRTVCSTRCGRRSRCCNRPSS